MLLSSRSWTDCKPHCHSLQHKGPVQQPQNEIRHYFYKGETQLKTTSKYKLELMVFKADFTNVAGTL